MNLLCVDRRKVEEIILNLEYPIGSVGFNSGFKVHQRSNRFQRLFLYYAAGDMGIEYRLRIVDFC